MPFNVKGVHHFLVFCTSYPDIISSFLFLLSFLLSSSCLSFVLIRFVLLFFPVYSSCLLHLSVSFSPLFFSECFSFVRLRYLDVVANDHSWVPGELANMRQPIKSISCDTFDSVCSTSFNLWPRVSSVSYDSGSLYILVYWVDCTTLALCTEDKDVGPLSARSRFLNKYKEIGHVYATHIQS